MECRHRGHNSVHVAHNPASLENLQDYFGSPGSVAVRAHTGSEIQKWRTERLAVRAEVLAEANSAGPEAELPVAEVEVKEETTEAAHATTDP